MRALRLALLAILAHRLSWPREPALPPCRCIQHRAVYDLKLDNASRPLRHHRHVGPHGLRDSGLGLRGLHGPLPLSSRSPTPAKRRRSPTSRRPPSRMPTARPSASSTQVLHRPESRQGSCAAMRCATQAASRSRSTSRKPKSVELEGDAVSDAAPARTDRARPMTGETLLRDVDLRRVGGRRQGDDHDGDRRQAGGRRQGRPRAEGAGQARRREILAGRHRLFRRDCGGRRGHAGIPHQLQALRERPDPRPGDGLRRLRHLGQAGGSGGVRTPRICTS